MFKSLKLSILFVAILAISASIPNKSEIFVLEEPTENHTSLPRSKYSYKIISSKISDTSLTLDLQYNKENQKGFYQDERNLVSENLKFEVSIKNPKLLSVKLYDPKNLHWEIPEFEPFPHDSVNLEENFNPEDLSFAIYLNNDPFSFKIVRKATKETIFDIKNFDLIFSEKYLEISSLLPTRHIFGLGERNHEFRLKIPGKYTLWNKDLFAQLDNGNGGKNTYGSHPMYLMHENSDKFHTVFLRNMHAMDIQLNSEENLSDQGINELPSITYKVLGGVLDFKFFIGETAEESIKIYHKYIGGHLLQPFWAFGFHQSRYGYRSFQQVRELLNKYQEHNMPLDAIWFDIDYKQQYRTFTVDHDRFNPSDINEALAHTYHKKLVIILDPGIAVAPGYFAYDEGLKRNIFIKNAQNTPLTACVWPGKTHFPDFMLPDTQNYWDDMVAIIYQELKFSGLWIDMNELANLVDGAVENDAECQFKHHQQIYPVNEKCGYTSEDYTVYNPGGQKLETGNICLNAKHYNNTEEYQVHNFNGFFNAKVTYNSLKDKLNFKQPFILTRSTAPGSGKFAMHWTGDNNSGYEWLKISIAGMLNFNLFGIPFVGADICGFAGTADEELCIRWMQLGSVYPFFRNHNYEQSPNQDPFSFSNNMLQSSLTSIRFRYSILKYFYSLFVGTHGFGTVMKPLFFEFPLEQECYEDDVLDKEFLMGTDLLITPVVQPHDNQIHPYFPGKNEEWYDIHNGERYEGGSHHRISNGLLDPIPMFLKTGSIIYRQEIDESVKSTEDLNNKFFLSIGLKKENEENGYSFNAEGLMMLSDDYKDYDKLRPCIENDCMMKIRAHLQEFKDHYELLVVFESPNDIKENIKLDKTNIIGVDIYGLTEQEVKGEVGALKICGHKRSQIGMEETEVKISGQGQILKLRFYKSFSVEPNDQLLVEIQF